MKHFIAAFLILSGCAFGQLTTGPGLRLGTGSTQAQRALVTGSNGGMQTDIYMSCTTGSNGLLGIGTEWAPYAAGTPDLFGAVEASLPSYCSIHLISGSYQKYPDHYLYTPADGGSQEIPSGWHHAYVRPGQKWYGNGSTIKLVNPPANVLSASWGSQMKYRNLFEQEGATPLYSGTTILSWTQHSGDGIEFHDFTLDLDGSHQIGSGSTGIITTGIGLCGDNNLIDRIHVINQVNSTNDGTEGAVLGISAMADQWFTGCNARNSRITNCTIDTPATVDGSGIAIRGLMEGIYAYGNTALVSATSGLMMDCLVEKNYVNITANSGVQGISTGGGIGIVARSNTIVVSGSQAAGVYRDTWDETRCSFVGNRITVSGDQSKGFQFGDGVFAWNDDLIADNEIVLSGTNLMFGLTVNSGNGSSYIQGMTILSNRIMLDAVNTNTVGIAVMSCTNATVIGNEIASGIGHSIVTTNATGANLAKSYANHSESGSNHLPWYSSNPGFGPWSRVSSPTWGIPQMEVAMGSGTNMVILGSGTGSTEVQAISVQAGSGISFNYNGTVFTISNSTVPATQLQTFGDASYVITTPTCSTLTVAGTTTLTSTRTVTLPSAASVTAGSAIRIVDLTGSLTSGHHITITRAGSDTIAGSATYSFNNPYGQVQLISDGISKWSAVVAPCVDSFGRTILYSGADIDIVANGSSHFSLNAGSGFISTSDYGTLYGNQSEMNTSGLYSYRDVTCDRNIIVKGGSNKLAGTVTLSSGAGTITSTAIDTTTVILLSVKTSSGTVGGLTPSTVVFSGSANITGAATDNSTYNWVGMKQY